ERRTDGRHRCPAWPCRHPDDRKAHYAHLAPNYIVSLSNFSNRTKIGSLEINGFQQQIQPNADLDWQIDASEACATDGPHLTSIYPYRSKQLPEPSQHACPSETTPGRSFAAVVAWKQFG